jgi:hypothetical protein
MEMLGTKAETVGARCLVFASRLSLALAAAFAVFLVFLSIALDTFSGPEVLAFLYAMVVGVVALETPAHLIRFCVSRAWHQRGGRLPILGVEDTYLNPRHHHKQYVLVTNILKRMTVLSSVKNTLKNLEKMEKAVEAKVREEFLMEELLNMVRTPKLVRTATRKRKYISPICDGGRASDGMAAALLEKLRLFVQADGDFMHDVNARSLGALVPSSKYHLTIPRVHHTHAHTYAPTHT